MRLSHAFFHDSPHPTYEFRRRFRDRGIDRLPRDACIVDTFCGRGNGLRVLTQWGFTNLTGVDLSPSLLRACPSGIRRIVADCTELKFPENSVDVFIMQGGLHHLPEIPADLERCLAEVHRSLKPGGRFFVVEPWNTPFLRFVRAVTSNLVARRLVPRFDAFATMVEEEWETYHAWLVNGDAVREVFAKQFHEVEFASGWGKCQIIATKNREDGPIHRSSRFQR